MTEISEAFLLPVLAEMLVALPVVLLGFHADNGTEYIHHRVEAMLKRRHLPSLTKFRAPQQRQRPVRGQERLGVAQVALVRCRRRLARLVDCSVLRGRVGGLEPYPERAARNRAVSHRLVGLPD